MFSKYFVLLLFPRFMHKLFKPKECAKKCKLQEICSIQSVTSKGLYACMESKGLKMI